MEELKTKELKNDLYGIFFDNDDKHINEVRECPQIRCIKVPGVKNLKEISIDIPEFASHKNGVPDLFIEVVAPKRKDLFDIGSGFNVEHYDILYDWIVEGVIIPSNKRYAIFDFDRTITQIEGFISPPQGLGLSHGMAGFGEFLQKWDKYKSLDITPLMMMTYLCGADRLPILQSAFDLCKDNGINIVILTNNTICNVDPLLLYDVMSVFNLRKEDFILLCSNQYRGDKKETLKAHLANICRFTGGGKGKKKTVHKTALRKKTVRKTALRKTALRKTRKNYKKKL